MLFHVTMPHSVEDCPGNNPDKMPEILSAFDTIDEVSQKFNVKVHFLVSGLPEHVEFALLEADSPVDLANFVSHFPYRQDYEVTAVEHLADVVSKMKAVMEQK